MKRPNDIDETASRANDWKRPEEREEDRNRPGTDGQDANVSAGGKRRRPGAA
jgi:hypothetical protein